MRPREDLSRQLPSVVVRVSAPPRFARRGAQPHGDEQGSHWRTGALESPRHPEPCYLHGYKSDFLVTTAASDSLPGLRFRCQKRHTHEIKRPLCVSNRYYKHFYGTHQHDYKQKGARQNADLHHIHRAPRRRDVSRSAGEWTQICCRSRCLQGSTVTMMYTYRRT